ncbi:hypothetical protein [Nitratireductor mangrovi]|uniref:hypothetical protein n=1 Tax=Nitratireductor mangrovi TaxID=2599600 RepID=UPI0011B12735|nr:hypothetical protein [Nitratireductor mangrovi]
MKTFLAHLRIVASLAVLLGAATVHGHAGTLLAAAPSIPSYIHTVAANCNAIGQQVAASAGGQLRRADAVQQGGQTVCVITYTVPSRDGKPPRRVQTTVNAG